MNERVAQDLDAHLEAAKRGEESGVAGLWHALNPLVLRYLRVVVGQAADDVASETWLQAAHELRKFRGDADGFRVWLFRVARHRALEELRRSGRRREDPAGLFGVDDRVSRDDPARERFGWRRCAGCAAWPRWSAWTTASAAAWMATSAG